MIQLNQLQIVGYIIGLRYEAVSSGHITDLFTIAAVQRIGPYPFAGFVISDHTMHT